jgi:Family of unknown function (DUF6221)
VTGVAAFVRARVDEDEAAAKAALAGPWMTGRIAAHLADNVIYGQSRDWPGHIVQVANVDYGHNREPDAAHIVRNDPQRVLAEVRVWRKILLEYSIPPGTDTKYGHTERETAKAAMYDSHPDYTADWPG